MDDNDHEDLGFLDIDVPVPNSGESEEAKLQSRLNALRRAPRPAPSKRARLVRLYKLICLFQIIRFSILSRARSEIQL